ncbi:MAG: D-2-hydroxyacid dehydrogenase [Clostridia bacterium]|nr:D-2-hydroxyacid dehydrogenase [Clostridia bacterium]
MRKLVVALSGLTGEEKKSIQEMAERYGLNPLFFERPEDALEEVRDAEIVFGQGTLLTERAEHLSWCCTPFAGVEPYLRPGAFASPDAILTNSSGAYGVTISEHIVMVTLEMMRREGEYREIVAGKGWRRDLPIRSIHGSRVLLFGTGDIGRETAKRLRAFSPKWIRGVNRSGRATEGIDSTATMDAMDQLLPETDLLIMSLPSTAETKRVMNADRLALLPEGAFLVNVGRGSALDEEALCALLRSGRLGGAALDVFDTEPLPEHSPLWSCPRLHITPHVAGNMTLSFTRAQIVRQFLENLDRYGRGEELLHVVDRKRGY